MFLNFRREVVVRARTEAVSNLRSSSKTVVSGVRIGLTDEEIVAVPSMQAVQKQVQRSRQPVSATSVDKVVDQVTWLDFFKQTEQGSPFMIHSSNDNERRPPLTSLGDLQASP
uniref:Uncharacterized protein n=1 Tax=Ditylenchus dipsaci TaxID=166011 RepID=A0A915EUW2_9BILA